jgi:hypothetical protein
MNQTTIKMPAAMLAAWLAALRSGKYKQGRGQLQHSGKYCCLGVLQAATSGRCEFRGLPSDTWMQANHVEFFNKHGVQTDFNSPYLPSLDMFAHTANDQGGHGGDQIPFDKIADAIEACAIGV